VRVRGGPTSLVRRRPAPPRLPALRGQYWRSGRALALADRL